MSFTESAIPLSFTPRLLTGNLVGAADNLHLPSPSFRVLLAAIQGMLGLPPAACLG